jgi:hypothetical protein
LLVVFVDAGMQREGMLGAKTSEMITAIFLVIYCAKLFH